MAYLKKLGIEMLQAQPTYQDNRISTYAIKKNAPVRMYPCKFWH